MSSRTEQHTHGPFEKGVDHTQGRRYSRATDSVCIIQADLARRGFVREGAPRSSSRDSSPWTEFRIEPGDDALVLAESLRTLAPLSTVVASQARAVDPAKAGP